MFNDDYYGPDALEPKDAKWEVQRSDGQWVLWAGRSDPPADGTYLSVRARSKHGDPGHPYHISACPGCRQDYEAGKLLKLREPT